MTAGAGVSTSSTHDRLCCQVSLLDDTELTLNLPVSRTRTYTLTHSLPLQYASRASKKVGRVFADGVKIAEKIAVHITNVI